VATAAALYDHRHHLERRVIDFGQRMPIDSAGG